MKVMIAVDGSEHAQYAFNWYLEHAHKTGNEVVLAHVGEMPIQPTYAFRAGLALPEEQWKAMVKEQEDKVTALKTKFGDVLKAKNIHSKFHAEEGGSAGQHLCSIAKKDAADMLVMGTRGQGTVRRTVLGSVSDYVLHHSHVPVIICHLPDDTDTRM